MSSSSKLVAEAAVADGVENCCADGVAETCQATPLQTRYRYAQLFRYAIDVGILIVVQIATILPLRYAIFLSRCLSDVVRYQSELRETYFSIFPTITDPVWWILQPVPRADLCVFAKKIGITRWVWGWQWGTNRSADQSHGQAHWCGSRFDVCSFA